MPMREPKKEHGPAPIHGTAPVHGSAPVHKNDRPENTSFRIWPGVVVITVCASLLFIAVYVVAYQAHLIPLPGFLQWGKSGEKQVVAGENVTDDMYMPVQESSEVTYYTPEEEEPATLLSAMHIPDVYHQRMRITRGTVTDSVDLYRQDDCWKLIVENKSGTSLYLWDGEVLYRENSLYPEGIETVRGEYTPESLLGLPTLSTIQSWDGTVTMLSENKALRVQYTLEDGSEWVCRVALDAALVTEVQFTHEGETILAMYTEYFDLAPETWSTKQDDEGGRT